MTHGSAADPTLVFSFVAGLASFLSPCVLPVIPAFLAHLGGTSFDNTDSRHRVFVSSLLFVVGFSVVFAVLGVVLNSFLRGASTEILTWLSRLAGVVILVFGLHTAGIVEFKPFENGFGTGFIDRFEPGYATSLVFGGAFAVGWTPCVGPLLGSVLSIAVSNPVGAFPLLTSYSLGLGVPFIVVGAFPSVFDRLIDFQGGFVRLRTVFGYIIIALSVLVFTQRMTLVANAEFLTEVVS